MLKSTLTTSMKIALLQTDPVTSRCPYEEIFKCRQNTCIVPLKLAADRTLFDTSSSPYGLSRTDRQLISKELMDLGSSSYFKLSPMKRYLNAGRARAFYFLNPDRTLFHTPSSLHVLSRADRQLILEGLSAPGKC
ncbi:hypothetical protein CDAR_574681 [Caerostris darwini]|uniref:Uncharacterized protein n=1 Tax=Caerostris darwini TaxID=1538125 RepID=A0AAV4QIA8_9ARAC|nr:hypothetical protein CDAR_574681 [Caerostris darwini]